VAEHRALAAVKSPAIVITLLLACSPEATRVRDGGPGADIGNKQVTALAHPDPQPADTTLMPGKALAPVTRFEQGIK
jgi:hypothetical protein